MSETPVSSSAQSPQTTVTIPTMPGYPDVPIIPGTSEAFTGTWRDPDGGAVVSFTEDGVITGTDGCNRFQSTWTLTTGSGGEDSVLKIAPFGTTMMACTGPWSPWVLSMVTIRHDGSHLTAFNAGIDDGAEIGRLIPAVLASQK